MTKKAFTVLELLFIVVIMGILSMVASPYFREDKLALATYQTLEHIRYAQHLAMINHRFDPKDANYKINPGNKTPSNNGKYFRSRWQIRFVMQSGTPRIVGYSVYSDRDRQGNIDRTTHQEAATNPYDGLKLNTYISASSSPDVNLFSKYSINNIAFSPSCQATGFTMIQNDIGAIVFDEKGRPYYGIANNAQNNPYQYKLTADCNITLTHQDGRQATITVSPESGYAKSTTPN